MPEPVGDQKLDAWSVRDCDFPAQGTLEEKLRFLLQYAILAPSGHNSQPWLFHAAGDTIEVYADRTRALPVADPEDRELVMSCGTALFHLRLAVRQFGYRVLFEVLPKPHDPDLLARVQLGEPLPPQPDESRLFHAIPRRRTSRMRFEERPVPEALLVDLQTAVRVEGASLEIIRGETRRNAVVDLVAEGDRLQMANKSFRRELAAWVRSNRSSNRDGIPGYGLGFPDLVSVGGPFVIRTFDLGGYQAARDRELADGSPVLAVISTEADLVHDWIAAGQALARLLLRARADNVWVSFLNQPIEVDDLRPRVREALNATGYPQLILRLGYGPEVRPTPRRPVDEVLI